MKRLILLIVMVIFCCRAFVLNAQDQYIPPDFPGCPDDEYDLIGEFEGVLVADYDGGLPTSITHPFSLTCNADLFVEGFAKEGHPESPYNCSPSGDDPNEHDYCSQTQDLESFEVDLGGTTFGYYTDYAGTPDIENAWFPAGPWETTAYAGNNELTFTHSYAFQDVGPQSVDYRVSVCAKCVVEEDEGCRVTAGGNKDGDINGKIHSWGGQAGAPARTDGNWTHRYLEERSGEKKQNPQNKFTFHSNDLRFIKCSDPGDFCHPARPADYRQIDFTGIGKIMNKRGGFVTDAPVGNLCFTVHLEDMGEPGHGGRSPSASEDCAHCPGTEIEVPDDCTNCTDYYEIKIYKDASIDTDTGECLGEFWWSNGDANG